MVLQTLFPDSLPPSRLVSSSGVLPQSAEGTAGGGGAAPGGRGPQAPPFRGNRPLWGTDMSYPSSLVVDIRSPVSDIQSPRLPIVKNIEQLPRSRVFTGRS